MEQKAATEKFLCGSFVCYFNQFAFIDNRNGKLIEYMYFYLN